MCKYVKTFGQVVAVVHANNLQLLQGSLFMRKLAHREKTVIRRVYYCLKLKCKPQF